MRPRSHRQLPFAASRTSTGASNAACWGRVALAAVFTASGAAAQTTFSIDYTGPTKSAPNACTGAPIREGDILVPATPGGIPAAGPLPAPCIAISAGIAGLGIPAAGGCMPVPPPGFPCMLEVDALSYGLDLLATPGGLAPGSYKFSVDSFAMGIGGTPMPPAVWSESLPGIDDISADTFLDLGFPGAPPFPPPGPIAGNRGLIDGDGLPSASGFTYPGLGLVEPNPPVLAPPNMGDNLDAVDVDGPIGFPVYFSLDAGFVDPLRGIPNTGSGPANGFPPGAVLATPAPGAAPVVFAPPGPLGLDFFGAGTDDLDALILSTNMIPGYQPSMGPYDWVGGATDELLFSLRRGSATLGMPDSIFGMPIEAGDILTTPLAGGVSPFPGIFIPAEALGLVTARMGAMFGDDIDALDASRPVFDCNGNMIEDAIDIAMGAPDCNMNGVPDGCECLPTIYCTAKVNSLGCTPAIGYSGMPSVSCATPFKITGSSVRNNRPGLLFYSLTGPAATPFQCGTLCIAPPIRRTPASSSGGAPAPANDCSGVYSIDFNCFAQGACGGMPDPSLTTVGTAVNAQWWGRDPGFVAPCNTTLTDGIAFVMCP